VSEVDTAWPFPEPDIEDGDVGIEGPDRPSGLERIMRYSDVEAARLERARREGGNHRLVLDHHGPATHAVPLFEEFRKSRTPEIPTSVPRPGLVAK
jgi:hypothetical protein